MLTSLTSTKVYEWVPASNGQVPPGAVVGGTNPGVDLYVCRAAYQGGIHPGKLIGGNCNIGWGGREIEVPNYEVLVSQSPSSLRWVPASNGQVPPGAVVGGTNPGADLYVCRATYQGGVHPGKLIGGNCNLGWGGQEIRIPNYEVLVCESCLNTFTPTKEQIDEYARSQGFPSSDYPYYDKTNSCGSGKYCKWVPNGWYPVSFNDACTNHDRCYMTYGTSQDECDRRFHEDLKAAVRRDLSQKTKNVPLVLSPIPMKTIVGGFRGDFKPTPIDFGIYQLSAVAGLAPPVPLPIGTTLPRNVDAIEPTSLARGLQVAEIYYRVVKGVGVSYHQNSQVQARKYKELVEAYIRRCQGGNDGQ